MTTAPLYCEKCGAMHGPQANFCRICGASLEVSVASYTGQLRPQHMLKLRYRILSQLGRGGFGAVYKAGDIEFDNRHVAVKEMSQRGLMPQEISVAAQAFKDEAHLLASLTHQSLPSIYDHFAEAGRWYLVMSFIEGETLEERLNRAPGKRLPLPEALEIGITLSTVLS